MKDFPILCDQSAKEYQEKDVMIKTYTDHNHKRSSPPRPATLLKETLVQVFSCEFCEISKNTFLQRTPLVAASIIMIVFY